MELSDKDKRDINEIMDEIAYQWSKKLDNGEIFVIKAWSWENLMEERAKAVRDIDSLWIEDKPIEEELEEPAEDFCKVHKVKMKERNSEKGKFYSHARQLDGGRWDYCSGSGWKSEL